MKITKDDIKKMAEMKANGVKVVDIARELNVQAQTINYHLRRNKMVVAGYKANQTKKLKNLVKNDSEHAEFGFGDIKVFVPKSMKANVFLTPNGFNVTHD